MRQPLPQRGNGTLWIESHLNNFRHFIKWLDEPFYGRRIKKDTKPGSWLGGVLDNRWQWGERSYFKESSRQLEQDTILGGFVHFNECL